MRILVVEDHADLAASLAEFLEAHGHSVDFAGTLALARQLARSQPFDVVVLDRMLPDGDGAQFCRELRTESNTVPVLMLTAMDTTPDKVAGFESGADDYLVKPFALAELQVRLQALHRRAQGSPAAVLRVADLEYDPASLRAQRGGRAVSLTPSGRRLLARLMRDSGRVVTRAELEQELWGGDTPPGDVLRAHMHALRAAIERPGETKLLHTVYGVGYRLAAENA